MVTFVVGCDDLFVRGLSLLAAWDLVKRLPYTYLLIEHIYDEMVAELVTEAEQAVAA